jgi:hypothetical protein
MTATKTPSSSEWRTVGKKRKKRPEPEKAVLYVEVDARIKELMEETAREHNRHLTGEVVQALQDYLRNLKKWPPAGDN